MAFVRVLIDGYNLLHLLGLMSSADSPGRGQLRRARQRLLSLLGQAIPRESRPEVWVVFDSSLNWDPAQSRDSVAREQAGFAVKFAREYQTADEQIIEMVRAHSAPQNLTVVTSDQQILRVARARKAQALPSENALEELARRFQREPESVGDEAGEGEAGLPGFVIPPEWFRDVEPAGQADPSSEPADRARQPEQRTEAGPAPDDRPERSEPAADKPGLSEPKTPPEPADDEGLDELNSLSSLGLDSIDLDVDSLELDKLDLGDLYFGHEPEENDE